MRVRVVNLTPHPVTLHANGRAVELPPADRPVPRCTEHVETVGALEVAPGLSVPVVRKVLGAVENLPSPTPGVCYIVSLAVAQAARRPDLLVPNEIVRDADGRVMGCRSLARVV